jgi:hypothetical protein
MPIMIVIEEGGIFRFSIMVMIIAEITIITVEIG